MLLLAASTQEVFFTLKYTAFWKVIIIFKFFPFKYAYFLIVFVLDKYAKHKK